MKQVYSSHFYLCSSPLFLHQLLIFPAADSGTEPLRAHGNAILESSVELAQSHGGVYIFAVEIIAGKLANEWSKEDGLEVLVRFVLPQGITLLQTSHIVTRTRTHK